MTAYSHNGKEYYEIGTEFLQPGDEVFHKSWFNGGGIRGIIDNGFQYVILENSNGRIKATEKRAPFGHRFDWSYEDFCTGWCVEDKMMQYDPNQQGEDSDDI